MIVDSRAPNSQMLPARSGRAESETEQSSEEQAEAIRQEVDYSIKASAVPRMSSKQ